MIDGFPGTRPQAMLMENKLTGVDLESEKKAVSRSSRLAPPPAGYLPDPDRPLLSGLDAVINLELSDQKTSLERALERVMLGGEKSNTEQQEQDASDANKNPEVAPSFAFYSKKASIPLFKYDSVLSVG